MGEEVSDRIIEQRWRNRIIEAIAVLSRGNEGLIEVNYNEFFGGFYDYWHDGHLLVRPNSMITEEEERTIDALGRMLEAIRDETRHFALGEQSPPAAVETCLQRSPRCQALTSANAAPRLVTSARSAARLVDNVLTSARVSVGSSSTRMSPASTLASFETGTAIVFQSGEAGRSGS
ncbi:hypothetical protein [Rhizobium leguminosarum]|uniref:hypothetical protein n=1 Tax=Rhizobium leguminosarum TaxID=384 RepID=UPI001C98D671|nr:hypothetical protein [Rhizobium leguminosarum]